MYILRSFLLPAYLVAMGCVISFSALAESSKRMVVLGIDGMDPRVLQEFMDKGLMPNLKRLASNGSFAALGTAVPPQSPVAWSSFITGMNPGGHGLFDFLALDRKTLQPYMSSVRLTTQLDWGTIPIGDWQLPIVIEQPQLLRKGKPFWEILGDHGVTTRIFQMPANYPPAAVQHAKVMSGMGTPDLRGTSGTFTLFTSDPRMKTGEVPGGEITRVAISNNNVITSLNGPANPFRAGSPPADVELHVKIDAKTAQASVAVGDVSVALKKGEWSDWVSVDIELIPSLISIDGMVRFYLQETEPFFRLYASPINIDPRSPAQPIASPAEYAHELAEHAGPFYTEEMPEDTKALSAGIFTPDEFIAQSGLVIDERSKLLEYELEQFNQIDGPAFLFFYFSTLDLRNHMLARQQDPTDPLRQASTPEHLTNAVQATYVEMDKMVGLALDSVAKDTAVIVMSDHGFSSFKTQVHLNRWLEQEGYLKLLDAGKRQQYKWLDGIDWSKTKAFAIGLNSLYINVAGREQQGIVPPAEREALAREIAAKLGAWIDEKSSQAIVTQPLVREDIYAGPELPNAPDILVGYGSGFRASWATTSGETPEILLEPNSEEWSGDHCVDSRLVPGVLLANRPLIVEHPDLKDVTAAIVTLFGMEQPGQFEGEPAF
jgi:predicted AlkP superfamily phosphohydrolase/phosphomutase